MGKDKLSWSESLIVTRKVVMLLFNKFPKLMYSKLFLKLVEACNPYIGIIYSAKIIDELAYGKNKERLLQLVVTLLTLTLFIQLIQHLITRTHNIHSALLYHNIVLLSNEKLLNMDFVDVDNSKTHGLVSEIYENQNSGGWGIYKTIYHIESLVYNICSIGFGITLSFELFTIKVSQDNYRFLNHPFFQIGVVFILALVLYLGPYYGNKSNEFYFKNIGNHNLSNRMFGYFGWYGYNRECQIDARMYEQESICEKYINDKRGTFLSKGPFAKLAKGPMGFYQSISSMITAMMTGIIYLFVCIKAYAGAFGIGKVTQYVGAINQFIGSIHGLIWLIGEVRLNAPFIKLLFEFYEIPNEMYQGSLTIEKRRDRKYEIEFQNVSFQYPNTDKYVLRNVSMKFNVGERVALVGQNGSGKTTFIKLLCRLYDPSEGEILLNGINIRKYNYQEYMSIFAIVFQDFKLLAYSIGENVSVKKDYDEKKVIDSLKRAGFHNLSEKFPKGMETSLYKHVDNDGIELSGGESQKIALARALYKEASFMILDEPTAALDPIAEAEVYSNFNHIIEDKTAVYISHRLSSCKFCDKIAVFHEGKIIETGSHEDLLSKNGKYTELWNAQAKYYMGDVEKIQMV